MKITQYDKILLAMLKNNEKKEWKATDFQHGEYFVGYEATARMSELAKMYPLQVRVGKEGRFRTLYLDWDFVNEEFKKQVNGYYTSNQE